VERQLGGGETNNNNHNIMSDIDDDDSPSRGSLDLESICPHDSRVDSTINLTPQYNYREHESEDDDKGCLSTTQYRRYSPSSCFNTTTTNLSADQNAIRRGVITDNNISGPAPCLFKMLSLSN